MVLIIYRSGRSKKASFHMYVPYGGITPPGSCMIQRKVKPIQHRVNWKEELSSIGIRGNFFGSSMSPRHWRIGRLDTNVSLARQATNRTQPRNQGVIPTCEGNGGLTPDQGNSTGSVQTNLICALARNFTPGSDPCGLGTWGRDHEN